MFESDIVDEAFSVPEAPVGKKHSRISGNSVSLEEAAGTLSRMMCEKFPESVVMARVYAVLRHGELDAPARGSVDRLVTGSGGKIFRHQTEAST